MAILRPVTKTLISSSSWGIPITDEVNRLTPLVDAAKPTAWTNLTLQNGWTASTASMAPQYRKVGDMVQIRGSVGGGSPGTTIVTLPAGFRSFQDINQVSAMYNGATWLFAVLSVYPTTGVIAYHTSSPAGATYLGLQMAYSTVA